MIISLNSFCQLYPGIFNLKQCQIDEKCAIPGNFNIANAWQRLFEHLRQLRFKSLFKGKCFIWEGFSKPILWDLRMGVAWSNIYTLKI